MITEALPPEAVNTGRKVGSFEVWETERWEYAVIDGKVFNVWRKDGPK